MEQRQPLLGVTAYVDVRSKHANHSLAVSEELHKLGAAIYEKLLPTVTHIIFKDGSKVTEAKAKRFGAHLVSVNWVDSCKQEGKRVAEHLYKLDGISTGKKKQKSMLPKDFNQELQYVSDKLAKGKKRKSDIQIPSPLKIVGDRININKYIQAPRTPPAMQKKLDQLRERQASASHQSGSRSVKPSGLVESPKEDILGTSPVLRPSQKSRDVIVPCTVAKPRLDPSSSILVPETQDHIVPETPMTWRSNSHLPLTPENKFFPTLDLDSSENGDPDDGAEMLDPPSPVLEWDVSINSFLNKNFTSSQSPAGTAKRQSIAVAKGSAGEISDMMNSSESDELGAAKNVSMMDVDPIDEMNASRRSTLCLNTSRANMTAIANNPPNGPLVLPRKKKRFVPPFLKPSNELSTGKLCKPSTSASKTNEACESRPRKQSVANIMSLHMKTVSDKRSNSSSLSGASSGHTALPRLDHINDSPVKEHFSNSKCKVKSLSEYSESISDEMKVGNTSEGLVEHNASSLSSIEISQLKISEKSSSTPADSCTGLANKPTGRKSRKSCASRKSKRSLELDRSDKENPVGSVSIVSSTPAEQAVHSPKKKRMRIFSDLSNRSFDLDTAFYTRVSKSNLRADQPSSADDEDEIWDFDSLAPSSLVNQHAKAASSCQVSSTGERESGRGNSLSVGGANIVLTSFHSGERSMVKQVIKKLGGYRIDVAVNENTTHVVCGDNRRTLNAMKGISSGCWVVSNKWVLSSLETSKWLTNEHEFVMTDAFPGANPQRRQSILTNQNKLFASVGPLYVAHNTNPPSHDLVQLIKLNGGQVVRTRRACTLVIGRAADVNSSRSVVRENWLLDCVVHQKLLDHRPYRWRTEDLPAQIDNDTSDIFEP